MGLRRGLPLGARACPSRSSARRRSTSSGVDLDGNEVSIEADELLGRLFQHELDHLDGVLLLERLDDEPAQGGHEGAASSHRPGHRRRCRSTGRACSATGRVLPAVVPALPAVSSSSARPPSPAAAAGARRRRLRRRAGRHPRRQAPVARRAAPMPSPVKAAALELGLPVTTQGRRRARRGRRPRRRRRLRPARSSRTCSTRCRWSTSTSRCCRGGAARRRSSGRSSPVTPRPACASCSSRRASTPARSSRASGSPIGRP